MSVRRAKAGDEDTVRDVRLAALADTPAAFASSLEHEQGRTREEWREWIERGAVFLHETAAGPRGVVSGVAHRDEPTSAFLIAMWVHPEARGRGAGDALVRAVMAWAVSEGFARVILDVGAWNEPAIRLYARHGFVRTGRESPGPEGRVEVEMEWRCRA